MATFVGKQSDFKDALFSLCELDYEAIEAYQAAINRLDSETYKDKLKEFMRDHERHTQEITKILRSKEAEAPEGPGLKEYLTQGKVVLANILGEKAILKAMLSNEEDTNTAYERVLAHENMWPEAKPIVQHGFEDEKKHKQWLEATINRLEE